MWNLNYQSSKSSKGTGNGDKNREQRRTWRSIRPKTVRASVSDDFVIVRVACQNQKVRLRFLLLFSSRHIYAVLICMCSELYRFGCNFYLRLDGWSSRQSARKAVNNIAKYLVCPNVKIPLQLCVLCTRYDFIKAVLQIRYFRNDITLNQFRKRLRSFSIAYYLFAFRYFLV